MVFNFVRKLDHQTLKYRKPESQRFEVDTSSQFMSNSKSQLARDAAAVTSADFEDYDEGDDDQDRPPTGSSTPATSIRGPFDSSSSLSNSNHSDKDKGATTAPNSSQTMNFTPTHLGDIKEDESMSMELNDTSLPPSGEATRDRRLSTSIQEVARRASVTQAVGRIANRRKSYVDNHRRTMEVFHQACFYLFTFYVTHCWSTTNRIMQQLNLGNTKFAIVAIHSFFDPLQGFLNYIVYQRPRYLRLRRSYPNIGRLEASWRSLRWSFLSTPQHWSSKTDIPTASSLYRPKSGMFRSGSFFSRRPGSRINSAASSDHGGEQDNPVTTTNLTTVHEDNVPSSMVDDDVLKEPRQEGQQ